ncbi:MAG: shikimate kinase [Treponema sp.]|jgi:shikimate kinase|nr:shikimate kinase [Treponema sp.]
MGISPFIRTIIILGPKHSGKTSAGRELAKLLGGPFTDLDELIEAQTGKSPRALFKESPATFQTAELQALASLSSLHSTKEFGGTADCGCTAGQDSTPGVIAAGGGIIDNAGARQFLLTEKGLFLVNLEVAAETAWERISLTAQGGDLPPFLNTQTPRETHHLLHERRAAAYREIAHLTIPGGSKTPEETGQEIYNALGIFIQLKPKNI